MLVSNVLAIDTYQVFSSKSIALEIRTMKEYNKRIRRISKCIKTFPDPALYASKTCLFNSTFFLSIFAWIPFSLKDWINHGIETFLILNGWKRTCS